MNFITWTLKHEDGFHCRLRGVFPRYYRAAHSSLRGRGGTALKLQPSGVKTPRTPQKMQQECETIYVSTLVASAGLTPPPPAAMGKVFESHLEALAAFQAPSTLTSGEKPFPN